MLQLWWAHQGAEGPDQELWQSLRVWLWLAPNSIRAIWKVTVAESKILSFVTGCWRRKKEVRGPAAVLASCLVPACAPCLNAVLAQSPDSSCWHRALIHHVGTEP